VEVEFDSDREKSEDIVEWAQHQDLEYPPGEGTGGFHTGYLLLGKIIEKTVSRPLGSWLQDEFFGPLGMRDTVLSWQNLPTAYEWELDQLRAVTAHPKGTGGDAALVSSPADIAVWERALHSQKLLSLESQRKLWPSNRGEPPIAWKHFDQHGRRHVGHGGAVPGFSAYYSRYLDDGLAVVVLSNVGSSPTYAMARDVAAIYFQEPYEHPKLRTVVKLDPALFDDYVGEYALPSGAVLRVFRTGERLVVQAPDQEAAVLFPESQSSFFLRVADAQVTFVRGDDGRVAKLVVEQNGIVEAKKLP
jgi:CubicO group peptidase (beta-lactamase class C family)